MYPSNLPGNLPQLWADKRALKRVQLNILTNAIKFPSEGGKAALSAHPVTLAIVVEVSDTGVGVPDDNWGRLSEPFVRGESNPYKLQERAGLGLSIVRSLVTLNGGALTIKSEVDVGTTVLVSFPT